MGKNHDPGLTSRIRIWRGPVYMTICVPFLRSMEKMVVNAASIITRARGVDLVVKIKTAILQSEHPSAVNYMRKVDAIRQLYRRRVFICYSYPIPMNLLQFHDLSVLRFQIMDQRLTPFTSCIRGPEYVFPYPELLTYR